MTKNYNGVTKNNNVPYAKFEFRNANGEHYGIKFGSSLDDAIGKVFYISGTYGEYNGKEQIRVDEIREAKEGEYKITDIMPVAPIDAIKESKCLVDILKSIEDSDYLNLCREIYNEYIKVFIISPASRANHHACIHGLLMHTNEMLKLADNISKIYPVSVNRSELLAAVFLHDVGKCDSYFLNKCGLVQDFTSEGQLLRHEQIACNIISKKCQILGIPKEKEIRLQHAIQTSKKEEQKTVVCMLLHLIDAMSASVNNFEKLSEVFDFEIKPEDKAV